MNIVELQNIQNMILANINPAQTEKFVIIDIVFLESGSMSSTQKAYAQIAHDPLKYPNIKSAKYKLITSFSKRIQISATMQPIIDIRRVNLHPYISFTLPIARHPMV